MNNSDLEQRIKNLNEAMMWIIGELNANGTMTTTLEEIESQFDIPSYIDIRSMLFDCVMSNLFKVIPTDTFSPNGNQFYVFVKPSSVNSKLTVMKGGISDERMD